MSELFVVGISWRTAPVAVREKLAFREEELPGTLRALTGDAAGRRGAADLDVQPRRGLRRRASPARTPTGPVRRVPRRAARPQAGGGRRRALRPPRQRGGAPRVPRRERARLARRSARRRSSASSRRRTASPGGAGTSGPVLGRCLERAFGVAKRVRTETAIARGAANVSSVAVELAARVFGDLAGKSVLVVGAGKMSTLAARHLYASGAQRIVVTNRSPEKAEALAAEIDGDREAVGRARGAARRGRRRDQLDGRARADPDPGAVQEGDEGAALAPDHGDRHRGAARRRAGDRRTSTASTCSTSTISRRSSRRTSPSARRRRSTRRGSSSTRPASSSTGCASQGVVPTIRALRERFAQVADAEVQKTLDALARTRAHARAAARGDPAAGRSSWSTSCSTSRPPRCARRHARRGGAARRGAVRAVRPRADRPAIDEAREAAGDAAERRSEADGKERKAAT